MTKQSVIKKYLRIDDKVDSLERTRLGLFFYNQRALVFGSSLATLAVLWVVGFVQGWSSEAIMLLWVLNLSWLSAAVATLVLHTNFLSMLDQWNARGGSQDLWPLFDKYFLLDSAIVFIVLLTSHLMGAPLKGVLFLLFANGVVYVSYVGGTRKKSGTLTLLILGFLLAGILLYLVPSAAADDPGLVILNDATHVMSILAMFATTFLSVKTIARQRSEEHLQTRSYLALLENFETELSTADINGWADEATYGQSRVAYDEREYRRRLRAILQIVCSEDVLAYQSACFWFIEKHMDRKMVMLPGPYFNYPRDLRPKSGVEVPSVVTHIDETSVITSLTAENSASDLLELFAPPEAISGAVVPIGSDGGLLGLALLYRTGKQRVPPPNELDFLRYLGSMIGNTMGQWRRRFEASAQREMNSLFEEASLDSMFRSAAHILKDYLMAKGCMILYRPNPSLSKLKVGAALGFRRDIAESPYDVSRGLTGQCADTGEVVRVDDAVLHASDFDGELFTNLQAAHKRPVRSWMAIPIGKASDNYGVIKVINSTFRCSWFTDFDEELGKNLALRLQVLIDRFLHIERTEKERHRAESNEANARDAQQKALKLADERKDDLMIITHQLQGALFSITGALTAIDAAIIPRFEGDLVEHAVALVDDAFALCYGTSTTFAKSAGRDISFDLVEINAVNELRQLTERLQRTTPRPHVTFRYRELPGFPKLQLDKNVFTSAFYSLIHNALKYADDFTFVVLEASYEERNESAALKVKSVGEPIRPDETERVFEKFKRGEVVDRGRLHKGVGLGLWVARELLRAVGGDLRVELDDRHPRLSVFVVTLPLVEAR